MIKNKNGDKDILSFETFFLSIRPNPIAIDDKNEIYYSLR